ncbi:MAG: TIGR00270 family protein [Candidatus Aenigmarchaeota archaeon]|nr:TIGR00270 family protein [Candidatus Aenigmarchaeota archaeon]
MECELCGRSGRLYKIKLEGAVLSVCKYCASLGERIPVEKPTRKAKVYGKKDEELKEAELVDNFAEKIKKGMEKRNFKNLKDFAKLLQIRASYLHRICRGETKPDQDTARKLEFALRIKILKKDEKKRKRKMKVIMSKRKQPEEDFRKYLPKRAEPLTIGDIAEVKKKK